MYCKIELNSTYNDDNFSLKLLSNHFFVVLESENSCLVFKNKVNLKFSVVKMRISNFVRLHGSLMLFAWIGCNALAIIISRYFRQNFPEKQILKRNMWFVVGKTVLKLFLKILLQFSIEAYYFIFKLHVGLNSATLFITIISIGIAFIDEVKISSDNLHGIYGFITLTLCFCQIFLGISRFVYNFENIISRYTKNFRLVQMKHQNFEVNGDTCTGGLDTVLKLWQ